MIAIHNTYAHKSTLNEKELNKKTNRRQKQTAWQKWFILKFDVYVLLFSRSSYASKKCVLFLKSVDDVSQYFSTTLS